VAFSRHIEDSRIATTIVASGEKEVGLREAATPYRIETQCFRFDCVGRLAAHQESGLRPECANSGRSPTP
jgi:hypothetical protein